MRLLFVLCEEIITHAYKTSTLCVSYCDHNSLMEKLMKFEPVENSLDGALAKNQPLGMMITRGCCNLQHFPLLVY